MAHRERPNRFNPGYSSAILVCSVTSLKGFQAVFGKLPSELTPEDIDRVRSEQMLEGSQVEFKETLRAKGSAVDRWVSGKDQVEDFARNELVEEKRARANAVAPIP